MRESAVDPFSLSLAAFQSLGSEKKDIVLDAADRANGPFIRNYFRNNPGISWIAIAFRPGNVIMFGEKGKEPKDEDLAQVAAKRAVPVFLYVR